VSQGIVAKVLADDEGRAAVERMLNQAKSDVRALLDQNRHLVAALRDALVEREELVGDEIVEALERATEDHRRELASS
jgi:ATP-dependent Zn protease